MTNGKMNRAKLLASMGAAAFLCLGQFAFAPDARADHNEATPAVMAPSGAVSGMDGSNGFDPIKEAHPPTAQDVRDTRYRAALATCNAVANTKKIGCRRSAKAAYENGKPMIVANVPI